MESFEHQEWRAQQAVNWRAVVKTALITGLIFFIMSGGGPWTTSGVGNKIMGRDVNVPFLFTLVGHFVVAFVYTGLLASVIYKIRFPLAVGAGLLVALGLYAFNFLLFRGLGGQQASPEFVSFFVHMVFGLFGSAIYKALSVERVTNT